MSSDSETRAPPSDKYWQDWGDKDSNKNILV